MNTDDRVTTGRTPYVATFDDGSQVLVESYADDDGHVHKMTAAKRPDRWATWGPPRTLEVAP
jgi:hypothetical protein